MPDARARPSPSRARSSRRLGRGKGSSRKLQIASLASIPARLPLPAAAIVCSPQGLKKFDANRTRAIRLLASVLRTGSDRAGDDLERHVSRVAADAAWEQAGIGPEAMDVAEVHDASAYAEIQQIENLGLCELGEGGVYTEQGHTALGGATPVNPSGGLVSKGHPVGATGIMQLHELVTQLRGEAGKRQVRGARIAVAENGGGFYETEEAATTVTVLEGPNR